MNKLLVILSALCLIFISCTNEEPKEEAKYREHTNLYQFSDDETICQLYDLNDSLINSRPHSRGFWSFFKIACTIAFADIKGAYYGYKYGLPFGAKEAWISAAVTGVGASASAGKQAFSRAISYYPQEHILAAYVRTISDPNLEQKKDSISQFVKIKIPTDYVSVENLCTVHNLTLKSIQTSNIISSIDINDGLTQEALDFVQSPAFKLKYNLYMGDPDSYSLDFALSDTESKHEYVIQLFLDLYNNYPEDIEDVNYIIDQYIDIIENDEFFSLDEKEAIYIAIAMAGYSTEYWLDNYPVE